MEEDGYQASDSRDSIDSTMEVNGDLEDDNDFDEVRENVRPDGNRPETRRPADNTINSPGKVARSNSKYGEAARSTARPIKAAIARKFTSRADSASSAKTGISSAEGKVRASSEGKTRGFGHGTAESISRHPSEQPAGKGLGDTSESSSARIVELDRALQFAKDEQKKLKEQLEKCKTHIKLFQEDVAGYKRDIDRRDKKIEEHEKTIDQLKTSTEAVVGDCERHIDKLQLKLSSVQAELTQISNERNLWASKHNEVRDEYLKLECELRTLQGRLSDLNAKWQAKWEQESGQFHSETNQYRDALHTAQKEKQDLDNENQELRRQVLELKHSISTSTRMESVITDNMVRESVNTLGHHLQNWTISNFRKAKIDVSELPEEVKQIVSKAVPAYSTLLTTSKLNVIQAVISAILVDKVFGVYFFGLLDERTSQIREMEEYLRIIGLAPKTRVFAGSSSGINDFFPDPGTPASTNQWRSLTLALIRNTPDPAFKDQTVASIAATADHINKTLTALTGIQSSDSRDRTLLAILEEAVELSRLFRAQRAQFRIVSPRCAAAASRNGDDSDGDDDGESFDGGSMEDINGEDETELLGRRVGCVTFPAVYKTGDGNGDNVHLQNVIVKARVLCLPMPHE
ncbi:hypothetical protein GP486_006085 [Trichoglossum hirsutum]|uniref:Uncharacterized protein n=1 Tax=Trichoglossum hirsutum TaxID=265104 RepID=A0A9P8L806_9PEZI|nr:hypothetical protein GP486_006085 [Trichoglossum hirsutum]